MEVSIKYGIDFGTTNSSISLVNRDKTVKLAEFNDYEFAHAKKSLVGFKDNIAITDKSQLKALNGDEDNPVRQVKMQLLTEGQDAEIPGLDGIWYSDVIAEILKCLKIEADKTAVTSDIKPHGVVIGLPCDIGEREEKIKGVYYKALIKAGYYSDLEDARANTSFLEEPYAVAVYYAEKALCKNKRVLIFDAGGGTIDLAILELSDMDMNSQNKKTHTVVGKATIETAGEAYTRALFEKVFWPAYVEQNCDKNESELILKFKKMLGGKLDDYLDNSIQRPEQIIFDKIYTSAGASLDFLEALEELKVILSSEEEEDFYFECPSFDGKEVVIFDATEIEREDFEDVLEECFTEIRRTTSALLEKSNLSSKQIDKVLLAGGSAAIPGIRNIFENMFGKANVEFDTTGKTNRGYYPNVITCISQGLGIAGYFGRVSRIMDRTTTHNYGFWDSGRDSISVVVPEGTAFSAIDSSLLIGADSTDYSINVKQVDLKEKFFELDIFEGETPVKTLRFDKTAHSGFYRIFFLIDVECGILEIRVYDRLKKIWISDLSYEERTFEIQ